MCLLTEALQCYTMDTSRKVSMCPVSVVLKIIVRLQLPLTSWSDVLTLDKKAVFNRGSITITSFQIASEYSIASSRTNSTDYGIYARRMALSQLSIEVDEYSYRDDTLLMTLFLLSFLVSCTYNNWIYELWRAACDFLNSFFINFSIDHGISSGERTLSTSKPFTFAQIM